MTGDVKRYNTADDDNFSQVSTQPLIVIITVGLIQMMGSLMPHFAQCCGSSQCHVIIHQGLLLILLACALNCPCLLAGTVVASYNNSFLANSVSYIATWISFALDSGM